MMRILGTSGSSQAKPGYLPLLLAKGTKKTIYTEFPTGHPTILHLFSRSFISSLAEILANKCRRASSPFCGSLQVDSEAKGSYPFPGSWEAPHLNDAVINNIWGHSMNTVVTSWLKGIVILTCKKPHIRWKYNPFSKTTHQGFDLCSLVKEPGRSIYGSSKMLVLFFVWCNQVGALHGIRYTSKKQGAVTSTRVCHNKYLSLVQA